MATPTKAVRFENPDHSVYYPSATMLSEATSFVKVLQASESHTYKIWSVYPPTSEADQEWHIAFIDEEHDGDSDILTDEELICIDAHYDRKGRVWVMEYVAILPTEDPSPLPKEPIEESDYEISEGVDEVVIADDTNHFAVMESLRQAAEEAAGQPVTMTELPQPETEMGIDEAVAVGLALPDLGTQQDPEVVPPLNTGTLPVTGARQYHIYDYPANCISAADRKKYRRDYRKTHPGYAGSDGAAGEGTSTTPAE